MELIFLKKFFMCLCEEAVLTKQSSLGLLSIMKFCAASPAGPLKSVILATHFMCQGRPSPCGQYVNKPEIEGERCMV